MKFFQVTAFAAILLIAGAPALSAQESQQEGEKPKQEEEKKKQPPPGKPKAQPKAEEKAKSEPRPDKEKQETDKQKQQKEQEKASKRDQKQATSQPSQSSASHKNVRRIPPERFQASFGTQHHFHVKRSSDRRFQNGGYWFEFVEVWPVGWSYEDDCYIEEDGDDYYLIDVVHPEVRLLIVVAE